MVELAISTETETACDGEWWTAERGREPEEILWLVAACGQRFFKPVLLGDVVKGDGWELCGSSSCYMCENDMLPSLCMDEKASSRASCL